MAEQRLSFVEGVRGLAAVLVLLGHVAAVRSAVPLDGTLLTNTLSKLPWWLGNFSVLMVSVFLFTSGFALAWSELRRRERVGTATPLATFVKRRAWRILPLYYVLLIVCAVAVLVAPRVFDSGGWGLAGSGPVSWGGFLSHLFFVHNWSNDWLFMFNPPMWSLAPEVQLYLLFPGLLWLSTKIHPLAAAAVAIIAQRLMWQVFGGSIPTFDLIRWFAVGIAAGCLAAQRNPAAGLGLRQLKAARSVLVGVLLVPFVLGSKIGGLVEQAFWLPWLLSFFLVRCLIGEGGVLSSRPVQYLGSRSYSIYLVHAPVVLITWAILRDRMAGVSLSVVFSTVSIAASLAVAELTFRLVELPSLRRARSSPPSAALR